MSSVKDLIKYFRYFRQKAGAGLYLLVALYFIGSYFNGFGFALLLPLLTADQNGFKQGQFESVTHFLNFLGVEANFTSLLVLFAFTFVVKNVFQFFQDWYRVTLATNLSVRVQSQLAESYGRLNFAFYSKTKSGFFTNIFTNEVNSVVNGIYGYIAAIGALLNSMVLFAFALAINPTVTLVALFGGALIFFVTTGLRERLTHLSKKVSQTNGSLVHRFIQFIVGFKYLKSVEGHFRYLDHIDEELRKVRALQKTHALNKAFANAIYEPINVVFLCAVIYVQVVLGGHSVTEVGVPLLLLNRFIVSFFGFQRYWHEFCGCTGSIHTLEEATELMKNNREHHEGVPVGELRQGLELKNLSFSYGDKQVLNKVSLSIPKNKCIGVVGDSGAGKTTLLNVLTGLLPLEQKDSLFYDDKSYAGLDKIQLRSKFGYITQEAVLFDATIEHNITLWNASAQTPEGKVRLQEAARMAHCLEFIQNSPEGFARLVGDRGTALSGGQRQRLMIAREIFRNPEILIFDEATSSLDSESEEYIQETMRKFLGNKTMVIVAHRVSSLRFCDYIYVLKDGRLVEQGTWDELLQEGKETYFSRIHSAQKI